jgi:hypothetical protein
MLKGLNYSFQLKPEGPVKDGRQIFVYDNPKTGAYANVAVLIADLPTEPFQIKGAIARHPVTSDKIEYVNFHADPAHRQLPPEPLYLNGVKP